jgi:uncharacterized membrane protein
LQAPCKEREFKLFLSLDDEDSAVDGVPYTAAENEESSANLWSVYISEAERYDKALVESWKEDMTGLLIFVRCLLPLAAVIFISRTVGALLGQLDGIPH